jgi:hypothetical protein
VTGALQGRNFRHRGASSFPKTPHMVFRSITIPNHGPSMMNLTLRLVVANEDGYPSLRSLRTYLPSLSYAET